ncbi:MAG: hypothetical protein A2Y80_02920 [Deltaproteobacteria bacterium RBG_13_58_19]|nr:MAG: hypothetical protein A2Y80_02920 [Deltaproteobacteria bacterium RBG_13_58_19]
MSQKEPRPAFFSGATAIPACPLGLPAGGIILEFFSSPRGKSLADLKNLGVFGGNYYFNSN